MSQSDLENEINKNVSKEIQRNVLLKSNQKSYLFMHYPFIRSTSFVLNEEEKEVIVDGEFRKHYLKKVIHLIVQMY